MSLEQCLNVPKRFRAHGPRLTRSSARSCAGARRAARADILDLHRTLLKTVKLQRRRNLGVRLPDAAREVMLPGCAELNSSAAPFNLHPALLRTLDPSGGDTIDEYHTQNWRDASHRQPASRPQWRDCRADVRASHKALACFDSSVPKLGTLERTIDLRQRRLRGDMVNKNEALKSS